MHTLNQSLAYIDPGSGALIWQVIVAGVASMTFAFRSKISALFSRKSK